MSDWGSRAQMNELRAVLVLVHELARNCRLGSGVPETAIWEIEKAVRQALDKR